MYVWPLGWLAGGTTVEFWMSGDAEAACAAKGTKPAGGAYNGMIKPLLNMTILGAIWYQGEWNQGDKYGNWDTPSGTDQNNLPMMTYGCRFPAMIADLFQKGDKNQNDVKRTSSSNLFCIVVETNLLSTHFVANNFSESFMIFVITCCFIKPLCRKTTLRFFI